jgi:hypothetical protein
MASLANVLNRIMVSVYPLYGGTTVRQDLHRTFHPFAKKSQEDIPDAHIMWTNIYGNKIPAKEWKPDHFVLLLHTHERCTEVSIEGNKDCPVIAQSLSPDCKNAASIIPIEVSFQDDLDEPDISFDMDLIPTSFDKEIKEFTLVQDRAQDSANEVEERANQFCDRAGGQKPFVEEIHNYVVNGCQDVPYLDPIIPVEVIFQDDLDTSFDLAWTLNAQDPDVDAQCEQEGVKETGGQPQEGREPTAQDPDVDADKVLALEYTNGAIYLGLLHEDGSYTFCSKAIAQIENNKDFTINITAGSLRLSTKKYDKRVKGLNTNFFINYFPSLQNVNGQLFVKTSYFSEILRDAISSYIKWNM